MIEVDIGLKRRSVVGKIRFGDPITDRMTIEEFLDLRHLIGPLTDPAAQKSFCTSFACLNTFACSYTFTNMMYQLPIDMITRMMSVPRDTKSPCDQSASRP